MSERQKVPKIKVLHIGQTHPIFDPRIFRKECSSLAKAGYSVSYLTSDLVLSFEGEKNDVYLRTLSGVKNPYRVKQIFSYIRQNNRIQKRYLCEVLAAEPDIVHIHEQGLGFLVKKLKKHSIKVIYDIHEDHAGDVGTYFSKYGALVSFCMSCLNKWQERQIVKAADGVITATEHIAELLMPDLKKKKWEVIYNYPILDEDMPLLPRDTDSNYICYTGNIGYTRKLEKTFEALAWLKKDIKILMIGNVEPRYREKLEAIYPNVKFCGFLDQEEIRGLHRGAFAGMCVLADTPNTYYSLPVKLFEYMRDGIPVIASDYPIWRSIIDKSHCGICVSDDVQAIGEAIDYLYTHQDVGRRMGEAGRVSTVEEYNWEQEEKKLWKLYHAITERENPA